MDLDGSMAYLSWVRTTPTAQTGWLGGTSAQEPRVGMVEVLSEDRFQVLEQIRNIEQISNTEGWTWEGIWHVYSGQPTPTAHTGWILGTGAREPRGRNGRSTLRKHNFKYLRQLRGEEEDVDTGEWSWEGIWHIYNGVIDSYRPRGTESGSEEEGFIRDNEDGTFSKVISSDPTLGQVTWQGL